MIDQAAANELNGSPKRKFSRAYYALVGAVCVLVVGFYGWSAQSGWLELARSGARDTYYNLLVQGFRDGQLNLKAEVPPGLARMADPYDPVANAPYRLAGGGSLGEMSYCQGKLYLYFGAAPALLLFWPWHELTGHFLLHRHAVVVFFSAGFLVGVGLLWALWRRYCPHVGIGQMVAAMLVLGLANLTPAILQRCDVYEVAISCGYALTMVTLLLLWQSMHAARGRTWWLAGASLAYGLAVAARPSLVLGAVMLLVPAVRVWRERIEGAPRPPIATLLAAATAPIMMIGLGLMLYNYVRFDDAFEFGQRYQLSSERQGAIDQFSLRYFWPNFRVSFLEPARWSAHFPFVRAIGGLSLPGGGIVEQSFGMLTNIPLLWLAVLAPLAWRGGSAVAGSTLRWFLTAVALFFGFCALTLCLHNSMCLRYELEFASPLVLLAVVGIFGLERALAGRLVWRRTTRWVWSLLLAFSVAFNLLAIFEPRAGAIYNLGIMCLQKGRLDEAIICLQETLAIRPDLAQGHNNLGIALVRQGRVSEAIGHYEQALRLKPAFAEAHNNLGAALLQRGSASEAIGHFQQALRLKPRDAKARRYLGKALFQLGRISEAIGQYEQALRLKPRDAEVRNLLGLALFQNGEALAAQSKWDEAIRQYLRAVEVKPDSAPAHESLGMALSRVGRFAEAVAHYNKALAIDPWLVSAKNNLAWVLATCGDASVRNGARAVELAEGANQVAGHEDPAILDTLAAAYAEVGRYGLAVRAARAAIKFLAAAGQAKETRPIQTRLHLYQARQPYHEGASAGQQP